MKTTLALSIALLTASAAFAAEPAGTHTMHDKSMKEAGHKDGEPMANKKEEAPPAAAPEEVSGKKHKMHSKGMKEAGHRDGTAMPDAQPGATPTQAAEKPKAGDPDTHTVHNKAMKEAGHKDGEAMKN